MSLLEVLRVVELLNQPVRNMLSILTTKMKKPHKLPTTPEIVFSNSDFEKVVPGHDDPMIILAKMVNAEVKTVFID